MKHYICIFSKYDDKDLVKSDLKSNPLNVCDTISIVSKANSLKKAFEKCVKEDYVNNFWSLHNTIYPFYMDKHDKVFYYHKYFNLD